MLKSHPIIILLSMLLVASNAQQLTMENFQCRNIANETTELLLDLVDNVFESVSLGLSLDKCKNQNYLVPKTIHWHLIAVPESEPPRISMVPDGMVQPFVRGGTLKFDLQSDVSDGLVQGEIIEAGVSIFLPPDSMKKIIVEGVGEVVEIRNNLTSLEFGSMIVRNSGVDNNFYLSSPNTKVDYEGSGVDNLAILEIASGSTIDLSGVDQELQLKTGDDADIIVTMSGVDQRLTISGGYTSIDSAGIDATIAINGPNRCDHIINSGISNSCIITEKTVSVPDVSCAATSNVQKWSCSHWGFMSTSAVVGSSIGLLAVIILCCALSCWGCYKCCGGGRRDETSPQPLPSEARNDDLQKAEEGQVVDAEVTGIDDNDTLHQGQSIKAGESAAYHQDDPTDPTSCSDEPDVVEAEIVVDGTPTRDGVGGSERPKVDK